MKQSVLFAIKTRTIFYLIRKKNYTEFFETNKQKRMYTGKKTNSLKTDSLKKQSEKKFKRK